MVFFPDGAGVMGRNIAFCCVCFAFQTKKALLNTEKSCILHNDPDYGYLCYVAEMVLHLSRMMKGLRQWTPWHKEVEASMECKIKNDIGTIFITEEVMMKVVGYAALECYGIVAMSSKRAKDGFVEWLGRENLSRGV